MADTRPKEEGKAEKPSIPAEVAAKLEDLGLEVDRLKRLLKDVHDANRLMTIVLFVGFLALLFSLGALMIEAAHSGSESNMTATQLNQIQDQYQSTQSQLGQIEAQLRTISK